MPRITEISDKFFNRDDAGGTLSEFTAAIIDAETMQVDVGIKTNSPLDFMVNGKDVSRLLTDRGTGRIYEGLKSLELMSRIIKGVGVSSSTLFDANIIAFSASDMQNASINRAYDITNTNLGVKDILDYARSVNSTEVAGYEDFVAKITREIKAGGFKTETYLHEALVRIKALIRSVLEGGVSK